MKKNNKKNIIIFVSIIFSIILLLNFSKFLNQNNKNIPEVKIKNYFSKNNMYAIMIEQDDGTYLNNTTFPASNFGYNDEKSGCMDKNGKKLNGEILTYNRSTKKVSLKTNQTSYCYLYFDKLFDGAGTEENPYEINNIEELVNLSKEVNKGNNFANGHFVLKKDLDFLQQDSYKNYLTKEYGDINGTSGVQDLLTELTTGTGWNPIGNTSKKFAGIFDGNNHKIDNLTINYLKADGTTEKFLGLFGSTGNATIKNLTIGGNITITPSYSNTGGLIGVAFSKTLIDNCHNKVNITSQATGYTNGGLVGGFFSSTMKNSSNSGDISGGNNAGGLVGVINDNSIIENSYNVGKVSNTKGLYVGGLIGRDAKAADVTTITNSYNEGTVISNREIESDTYTGGIIGLVHGIINIDKSYNSGEIRNDRTTYTKSFNIPLGGLIGQISGNGTNISRITNSYNEGHLIGATKQGGLLGYNINNTILIINNCYNKGTNESDLNAGYMTTISGIVGYNSSSKLYVLNSNNQGSLSSAQVASGISYNDFAATTYIINTYNIGTISGKTQTSGLFTVSSTNINKIFLNNVYNLGELKGNSAYAIGNRFGTTAVVTASNLYYPDNQNGINISNIEVNALPIEDMKNNTFVNNLNSNLSSIKLTDIDSNLTNYTISRWILGKDNYPILANGIVKDLSKNGNMAVLNNISEWNNDGLTTSNETQTGYVNCGLENFNFENSLSWIIRLKFNKLGTYQRILGNWESAGGGLALETTSKVSFALYGMDTNPAGYKAIISNSVVNATDWYTLVGNYDGSEISIYINGIKAKSTSLSGRIAPSKMPIIIGGNPDNSPTNLKPEGPGLITVSDFIIFNRALTNDEIQNNYSGVPNLINEDQLLLHYKFNS